MFTALLRAVLALVVFSLDSGPRHTCGCIEKSEGVLSVSNTQSSSYGVKSPSLQKNAPTPSWAALNLTDAMISSWRKSLGTEFPVRIYENSSFLSLIGWSLLSAFVTGTVESMGQAKP